jgi:uncharacterized protein YjbI with pentapeptide repeats
MLFTHSENNNERLRNLDVFKNVLHPYQFYHQVPYHWTRGKSDITYMVEKAIENRRSLSRLDLSGLGYSRASISGGDFRQSKLIMSRFDNTNCTNTNFEGADLTGARFFNSTLIRANFKNANLSLATITDNCNFYQANFEGAIFDGTIFNSAMRDGSINNGWVFNLELLNQKVANHLSNNYGLEDGSGRTIPAGENPRNDNTRNCVELIPLVDDINEEPEVNNNIPEDDAEPDNIPITIEDVNIDEIIQDDMSNIKPQTCCQSLKKSCYVL